MKMPPSSSTVTGTVTATVAAVVPHWNRRDLLAPLLDDLSKQQRPFNEIIVVDNGSTDGSADLARQYLAKQPVANQRRAHVIQLDRNLGFAAAVNRGIKAAQSDWIAIINNDVTLAPDWLAVLLAAVSRQDVGGTEARSIEAWFATGKILSASDPSRLDGAFDELSRGACAARCGSGKSDGPIWNQPRQIRFAPMTAALFRSELFRRLGGLDEIFGSYMEDVEFGIRCALAGYGGTYVPAAVAHHQGSATLGRWSADAVWRISRNQVLLAAKHFTGEPRLPIVVGQALWGLVALRHGCGCAFLRGKLAGWTDARRLEPRNIPADARKSLAAILEASETEIFELGRQTGLDHYWRAYFWLLRR